MCYCHAKAMLCIFVRRMPIAQVFVRRPSRRTSFCATAFPSHKFLCDGLPVAQKHNMCAKHKLCIFVRWLLQIPSNGQQQPSNTHQQHPTLSSRLQHTNPPPPSTTANNQTITIVNNQTITTAPTQHHSNNNITKSQPK